MYDGLLLSLVHANPISQLANCKFSGMRLSMAFFTQYCKI